MTMLNNTPPEGEETKVPELLQMAMPDAGETPAETMTTQSEAAAVEPGHAESSARVDEPRNETPNEAVEQPEHHGATPQQRYWQSVLTGNADTVPMSVRERSGANDVSLSPEQREYNLFSAINRSWVADHRNHSREEIAANWHRHRAQLASELSVADDEGEVFMALSAHEAEAPRREMGRRVYELAYKAALHGEERYDLSSISSQLNQEEQGLAERVAIMAFNEGEEARNRWLPLAMELTGAIDVFAAVEEEAFSAPRVFRNAPALYRAVDALADMAPEDRQTVTYLALYHSRQAQRERGETPAEQGLLSRGIRAVRRGATSLGFGVLQALNHTGIATLDNLGSKLGGEWGEDMRSNSRAWDRRMRVLNDVRHLAQQEVVPLTMPGAGVAEEMFIEGAQAIPAAVLSCCGGAGFGALSFAGMGESVAEARRRAPEGPQYLQLAAGVIGGVVQGGIYMGLNRVGGKMFERSLSNFMRARGRGVMGYSLEALRTAGGFTADGVKLMLAGKAAQAADLGAHELAAQASSTASNINWQAFGDNITDIEVNLREAAATLPFLLIGAGHLSLHHFRSADSVLGSGRRLLEWKVPAEKVEAILSESDVHRRNELLREALRESELWSSRRYSFDIMRAMQLLNTDGNPVFRHWSDVAEFLKLSSDFAGSETMAPRPAPASERARRGLMTRDGWVQRARLNDAEQDLAVIRSENGRNRRGLMNGRGRYRESYMFSYENMAQKFSFLHNTGIYAPQAEGMRQAILDTYSEELRRCSYRLLLQLYSQDAMTQESGVPIEDVEKDAEETRRRYLGMAAGTVLDIAGGRPHNEAYDALAVEMGSMLADFRKGRCGLPGLTPQWLLCSPEHFVNDITSLCLTYDNKRMDDYPDMRNIYRLLHRTRVCAAVLRDFLPMSEQFQTELSNGKTPQQAFASFLENELGLDALLPENQQPLTLSVQRRAYEENNARRVQLYMDMTGHSIESVAGDDGNMYFRLMKPDGHYSSWYPEQRQLHNAVASSADLMFMPLGTRADALFVQEFESPDSVLSLPSAGAMEYSGYDQLCAIALQELAYSWLQDASTLQPGMFRSYKLSLGRSLNRSSLERPIIFHTPGSMDYGADHYCTMTPLGLALARFTIYWARQLNSGIISAEHLGNYLNNVFGDSPYAPASELPSGVLEETSHRINRPLKETLSGDVYGVNVEMAEKMGRYTLLYFLAHQDRMPVPSSFRTWYGGAAFSPEFQRQETSPINEASGYEFEVRDRETNALRWINSQVSIRLQELMPHVRYYRDELPPEISDDLIARLMPAAFSMDEGLRAEQAWGHFFSRDAIFCAVDAGYWNLLKYPMDGWRAYSPVHRTVLEEYMQTFCEEHAHLLDGVEALPESPVLAAISNLNDMLQEYPELHHYSYRRNSEGLVNTLVYKEPRRQTEYTTVYLGNHMENEGIRSDYDVQSVLMPDFLLKSPRAHYAVMTLDLLRAYPVNLPYSEDGEVWWQGKRFGGSQSHPQGLEKWQPRECLRGLRNVLWDVIRDNVRRRKTTITMAGQQLPLLFAEELECNALSRITVYESPLYAPRTTYRLMPGMLESASEYTRLPYVVGARSGVHIGTGSFSEEKVPEGALVPLHDFIRRSYLFPPGAQKDALEFRRRIVRDNLAQVFEVADSGACYMSDLAYQRVYMPELMLRLFEDTGFSERLLGTTVEELNVGGLRALRLASDMISCIAAPELLAADGRGDALVRLKETSDMLRGNPVYMDELTEALVTGNEPPVPIVVPVTPEEPVHAAPVMPEVTSHHIQTESPEENSSPEDTDDELHWMRQYTDEWRRELLAGVQEAAARYDEMISQPGWAEQEAARKKSRLERIRAHAPVIEKYFPPSLRGLRLSTDSEQNDSQP